MVTGFWVHRFRPKRPALARYQRSKETIVARRERPKPQTREIRIMFEPHRLSPAWVAQAYEQVVPIARRSTPQALAPDPRGSEQSQRADTPAIPPASERFRENKHDAHTAQMSR